jgi:hypothetical protein
MRETRTSGSEGGGNELNRFSLPLFDASPQNPLPQPAETSQISARPRRPLRPRGQIVSCVP